MELNVLHENTEADENKEEYFLSLPFLNKNAGESKIERKKSEKIDSDDKNKKS